MRELTALGETLIIMGTAAAIYAIFWIGKSVVELVRIELDDRRRRKQRERERFIAAIADGVADRLREMPR